jgi:translation initiation factor eIF-2B subunit delta
VNKSIDNVEGDRILHPATIKLGSLYSKGTIQADDDRVTALVAAFCNIIQDYKTPPKKVLREDLDKYISKQVCTHIEATLT